MRNFLQRSKLRQNQAGRQGVGDKFSVASIVVLALALELHRLGLDASRSASMANVLLRGGGVYSERSVSVTANVIELEWSVRERLREAAEFVVRRRRGRPRSARL